MTSSGYTCNKVLEIMKAAGEESDLSQQSEDSQNSQETNSSQEETDLLNPWSR